MVSLDGIVNEIKVFLLLFVDGFLEGTTRSGAKTHQWRHVLVLFQRDELTVSAPNDHGSEERSRHGYSHQPRPMIARHPVFQLL